MNYELVKDGVYKLYDSEEAIGEFHQDEIYRFFPYQALNKEEARAAAWSLEYLGGDFD